MNTKIVKRTAEYWIQQLRLLPHPEGGYYREIYRSPELIADLPKRYKGRRPFATAIYFLLRGDQFSSFHRLKSDEIWHFYSGVPVSIFVIGRDGRLTTARLGLNTEKGELPMFVIPAGSWFAAALSQTPKSQISNRKSAIGNKKPYTLLGCTVAPGFDFADFELGNRLELCRQFPKHRALITKLTMPRNPPTFEKTKIR